MTCLFYDRARLKRPSGSERADEIGMSVREGAREPCAALSRDQLDESFVLPLSRARALRVVLVDFFRGDRRVAFDLAAFAAERF